MIKESESTLIFETIVQRLKRETRVLHEQVEAVVGIMHPQIARADYVRYLSTLLGYYAPLERQLRNLTNLYQDVPDLDRRWKVPLLEQDLRSLGLSEAALASLPNCQRLPSLGHVPRALGLLYVLEGSTLGGQVIYRRLRDLLPEEVGTAASFLLSYGPDTVPMWQEFRRLLTACARSVTDEDLMVSAAAETFITLKDWFVTSTHYNAIIGEAPRHGIG